MASFDRRITALTGSAGEVAAVAAAFGAHYAKVVSKDGNVTFDHTLKTYILDRDRHLAGAADHQTDAATRHGLLGGLIARE
jgi:protein SCO1/2